MPTEHTQLTDNAPASKMNARITLLVVDPGCLYAFWEVNEEMNEQFTELSGSKPCQDSIPVLKITNQTNGGSFFIRINDFSDSWYINVPQSNCRYTAGIGRKTPDGLYVGYACSNTVLAPADNISSNTEAIFVDVSTMSRQLQGPGRKAGVKSDYYSLSGRCGISSGSFLKG